MPPKKEPKFEAWLTQQLSSDDGAMRTLAQNLHCERYVEADPPSSEHQYLEMNGAERYSIARAARNEPHPWRCRGQGLTLVYFSAQLERFFVG